MSETEAGTRSLQPDELVDTLVQSAFATMGVLNRICAEHDLSLTLLRVLAILWDRRLRVTALADYLGLDKSSTTGMVGRAEKRGLLRRAPSPHDGRAVDVFITPAGAELAERIRSDVARALAPMTDELTHAEQRRLQALLQRVTP
ncbi:MarR family winged helix-turn-helix transcriptional regulator [Kutzneria buriramensis]|uniref:DNA-binding MarR family transcriptional regulator n=1 Tax=Kutzneria buriramensis TaxID=1045776 RepID=A0A3E0H8N9_9PSEU|nr:MarR family transcriptional regulator [Kutzneria buriramensis]REH39206.1 DNA-binding MarR family transcriptional regulator [Kutzneria buriramensis]